MRSPSIVVPLWEGSNPENWTRPDQEVTQKHDEANFLITLRVSKPQLALHTAPNADPDAPTILICPGGGYGILAIEHEGWEIAEWLNRNGIHAAVLKYRLPNEDELSPIDRVSLQDAQRAMRILRQASNGKIGVMGFSAGGHLAAALSCSVDAVYDSVDAKDEGSFRPDFTVLIYPAYLDETYADRRVSRVIVNPNTPPAFLVHTEDDYIPMESSCGYARACEAHGIPAELHTFPTGGHGYGLRSSVPGLREWPDLMLRWLKSL